MLKGTFFTYNIKESLPGSLKASVQLNASHSIYEGHFPQKPIVPGVCQVQIIKEILEDTLNKECRLVAAKDIKFLNMISPDEINSFDCEIDYNEVPGNKIDIKASLVAGETKLLRIRASFL